MQAAWQRTSGHTVLTVVLAVACGLLLLERESMWATETVSQYNTNNMHSLRETGVALQCPPPPPPPACPAAEKKDGGACPACPVCKEAPPPPACPSAPACPSPSAAPALPSPPPAGAAAGPEGTVVSAEAHFCSAHKTMYDPIVTNTIAKVLHVGVAGPQYWIVPPIPDLKIWATKGLENDQAGHETGYGGYQHYVTDLPKDAIMLDIGGHSGAAMLPVAATGRSVITFEPVPRNQQFIKLGVCLNGFHDRVRLVKAAVGKEDGEVTIYVPRGRGDNAALSKGASTANVGGEADPVTVPLIALDSFMDKYLTPAEVARIGFVKIDVQGQEGNVVRGGQRLLSSLKPGTWVMAEHDGGLIGNTIGAGYLPDPAGWTMDIEGMIAAGYTVHAHWKGEEVHEGVWRHQGPPEGDWWYRKK